MIRSEWGCFVLGLLGLAAAGLFVDGLSTPSLLFPGRAHEEEMPPRTPRLSLRDFERARGLGRPFVLVDVRSDQAWALGHARGAIHLPLQEWAEGYKRLDLGSLLKAAEAVVVLCDSARCGSADQAAELLTALGHSGVYVLEGGWEAYGASGLEVLRP